MGKKLRGATKTTLTLRQGLPQVPLTNKAEQLFDRPLRGLRGATGGRGLPPLPLGGGGADRRGLRSLPLVGLRRAAGDCRPCHWVGGGGGPQGTAAPTIGWFATGGRGLPPLPLGWRGGRTAGDCGPYLWGEGGGVRSEWRNVREAFVVPRSLLIVSRMGTGILSRRNGHPVSPERRCRCAGTATPLRRNGDAVAPERPPRCAGTVIPLRRNGHPVAPERPCGAERRRPTAGLEFAIHKKREGVGSWKDDGGGWGRRGILLGGACASFPFASTTEPSSFRFRSLRVGTSCSDVSR